MANDFICNISCIWIWRLYYISYVCSYAQCMFTCHMSTDCMKGRKKKKLNVWIYFNTWKFFFFFCSYIRYTWMQSKKKIKFLCVLFQIREILWPFMCLWCAMKVEIRIYLLYVFVLTQRTRQKRFFFVLFFLSSQAIRYSQSNSQCNSNSSYKIIFHILLSLNVHFESDCVNCTFFKTNIFDLDISLYATQTIFYTCRHKFCILLLYFKRLLLRLIFVIWAYWNF